MRNSRKLELGIIIPFKNKSEMTIGCVRSLLRYGPRVNELLLISNNSDKVELEKISTFTSTHSHVTILEYNKPFNYQEINNWAISKSNSSTILFLNNDTELTTNSRGLIEAMYKKAQQPKIGAVGCLLLYGDGRTIQHAGVYLTPGGLANHLYRGKNYVAALTHGGKNNQYPYTIKEDRILTAVTAAAYMVSKKKLISVGGFDERFTIGGGDVDLCIRLGKSDFQTCMLSAENGHMLHKERKSRNSVLTPFNDLYWSYLSYITVFDLKHGDPYLPLAYQIPGITAQ